jgi:hypothetical protein
MGIFVFGSRTAEELGFSQFHDGVDFAGAEPERYLAMLEWAERNRETPVFVSPSAVSEPLLDALAETNGAPENVLLPSGVWRESGLPRRVFLNLGGWESRGMSPEEVAGRLPRLRDTRIVCRPADEPVAEILSGLGEGEMSYQVVVADAAMFREKYRGYADMALNWLACWMADAILSWDAPIRLGSHYWGSLTHAGAVRLAEFFRLPAVE